MRGHDAILPELPQNNAVKATPTQEPKRSGIVASPINMHCEDQGWAAMQKLCTYNNAMKSKKCKS